MQSVMTAHGVTMEDLIARMTMFGAYQFQELQTQKK
jgi:hypothetical protein